MATSTPGLGVTLRVADGLQGWLDRERAILRESARHAMREAMPRAEDFAKAEHGTLAGWNNDTGNLERTITGYVVGDGPDAAYYWKDAIEVPPNRASGANRFKRDDPIRGGGSRSNLAQRYRFAPEVSPYVDDTAGPDEVVGILHKYMAYAGYVQRNVGGAVTTAALEAHADELAETLASELARGIDIGGAP